MAQILWTVAIACVLHDVTVNLRMYRPHEQKALMRRFHLAVWGAALLSALLPFTTGSYGSTGSWCWIEQTDPRSGFDVGTMWRYLVLYCPLWAGEWEGRREGGLGLGGGRGWWRTEAVWDGGGERAWREPFSGVLVLLRVCVATRWAWPENERCAKKLAERTAPGE